MTYFMMCCLIERICVVLFAVCNPNFTAELKGRETKKVKSWSTVKLTEMEEIPKVHNIVKENLLLSAESVNGYG